MSTALGALRSRGLRGGRGGNGGGGGEGVPREVGDEGSEGPGAGGLLDSRRLVSGREKRLLREGRATVVMLVCREEGALDGMVGRVLSGRGVRVRQGLGRGREGPRGWVRRVSEAAEAGTLDLLPQAD